MIYHFDLYTYMHFKLKIIEQNTFIKFNQQFSGKKKKKKGMDFGKKEMYSRYIGIL